MSTRATIATLTDGKIKAIYCHWDGYPEYVSNILVKHYKNIYKIEEMLKLGHLSNLGKEIGVKHDFKNTSEEYCTFYGRDREEIDQDATDHETVMDWLKYYDYADFAYLYVTDLDMWSILQSKKVKDKPNQIVWYDLEIPTGGYNILNER